jgi:hypothetical protein
MDPPIIIEKRTPHPMAIYHNFSGYHNRVRNDCDNIIIMASSIG